MEDGIFPFNSAGFDISDLWTVAAAVLFGGTFCGSYEFRNDVFEDHFTILFCGIDKACGRRNLKGNEPDGTVCNRDLYRPDPSGNPGYCSLQNFIGIYWNLVRMADRMEYSYNSVSFLLYKGTVENAERDIVLGGSRFAEGDYIAATDMPPNGVRGRYLD